jgi:hypothetical protein
MKSTVRADMPAGSPMLLTGFLVAFCIAVLGGRFCAGLGRSVQETWRTRLKRKQEAERALAPPALSMSDAWIACIDRYNELAYTLNELLRQHLPHPLNRDDLFRPLLAKMAEIRSEIGLSLEFQKPCVVVSSDMEQIRMHLQNMEIMLNDYLPPSSEEALAA